MVGRLRVRTEPGGDGATTGVIGIALAVAATLLHAATAQRYGYFRDELYFIACSKHLAWGYVDQPPLVAFAAWLSAPLGYHLLALRALPILAAAATACLAAALARELGGGRFAQTLAGIATLLTPAYLLLGNTLTTTSFEPLSWTLAIYACVRIVRGGNAGRWWTGLAVAVAFGAYGKYSIGLLIAGLAIGVLATPQRRCLRTPWLPYAAGLCLLLLAPNLAWQASHGWPIFAVLHGDALHRPAFQSGIALESVDLANNALAFSLEQLLYTNVFAVPIWLAGAIAPFRTIGLRDLRFVPIAYLVVFAIAAALGAKGYYVVGIYATLLAIGAVAVERYAARLRNALFGALALTGIAAMPLSLPVLAPGALIAYGRAIGLTGRNGTPPHLIQPVFAEEFGWERLARDVSSV